MKMKIRQLLAGSYLAASFLVASCGGGASNTSGVSNPVAPTPVPVQTDGLLTLVSGSTDGPGNLDGQGTAAKFLEPWGIARDSLGNLFVADRKDHTIRKITATGDVTTFAGLSGAWGSDDGKGSSARFTSPTGVAVDLENNIYVTESDRIRKLSQNAEVTTLPVDFRFGERAQSGEVSGIVVNTIGTIFVNYGQKVRKINPDFSTTLLADFGSDFEGGGCISVFSSLDFPGITIDKAGNIYTGASCNAALAHKISPQGVISVASGLGKRLAVDNIGNVFSLEKDGVQQLSVDGSVRRFANFVTPGSSYNGAGFGLVSGNDGTLYFTGAGPVISKVTANGTSILAGSIQAEGSSSNENVTRIERDGNVFQLFQTIKTAPGALATRYISGGRLEKQAVDGSVTTLWQSSSETPLELALDPTGNLYFSYSGLSSSGRRAVIVAKVTPQGISRITTIGRGSGTREPFVIDAGGNVIALDESVSVSRLVKTAPTGARQLLAGSGVASGFADGKGEVARFSNITDLVQDSAGNTYVADTDNHVVRKVSPDGVVSTIAGRYGLKGIKTGSLPGSLYYPNALTLDSSGYLFIGSSNGSTVKLKLP